MLTETPLVQQFINEGKIEALLLVIESRFGAVPEALSSKLEKITEPEELSNLLRLASTCRTVKSIEQALK